MLFLNESLLLFEWTDPETNGNTHPVWCVPIWFSHSIDFHNPFSTNLEFTPLPKKSFAHFTPVWNSRNFYRFLFAQSSIPVYTKERTSRWNFPHVCRSCFVILPDERIFFLVFSTSWTRLLILIYLN